MKYFGLDRVIEPLGAIPTTSWRMDNSKNIGKKEMRVAVEIIKLERDNFNQICSACNYNEAHIKEKIFNTISRRGKLQNPYTESCGLLLGTIEEISPDCHIGDFKVGDEIITLTSIAGCPMYLESIDSIDYDYGEIWCSGYAILFESTKIAKKPADVDIKSLLFALDEEGSLIDVRDVLVEKQPKKVAVLGSTLFETMLYAKMARGYNGEEVRVIAIVDSRAIVHIKEASFARAFDGLVDEIYFVDMTRPVEAYRLVFEKEGNEFMDAIINLEDVKGVESIAAMLVKNNGFLFHTGVKRSYFQSMIAMDCLGKEVTSYALAGYAEEVFDFAKDLVKKLEKNIKAANEILAKRPKKSMHQQIVKAVTGNLEVQQIEDFIFMSPATEELVDTVLNIAKYDCNVIIQGETGVGKEKILNLLHQHSSRKGKPCIKINCATIQENLAESEFFGYEKGSFTGAASSGKDGYFEMANNGTLFLDEIGSLPLAMQSKLLRVLQENSYYRVGGTEQRHVDVRVVCANNIPLKKLVDEGKFREDLYYRLNICLIDVPPLRKRKEDVFCLADYFIKNYSKKYGVEKSFSYSALNRLSEYHWPGNVRELENAVHRLYISEKGSSIEEEDVDRFLNDSVYDNIIVDVKKTLGRTESVDFVKIMDEQEKRLISYALEKEKTTRKAAEFLNIPQATLARKKIKYNL